MEDLHPPPHPSTAPSLRSNRKAGGIWQKRPVHSNCKRGRGPGAGIVGFAKGSGVGGLIGSLQGAKMVRRGKLRCKGPISVETRWSVLENASLMGALCQDSSHKWKRPSRDLTDHAMPKPTISPCSSCVGAAPTLYDTFQRILTVLPLPLSTPFRRNGCVMPFR